MLSSAISYIWLKLICYVGYVVFQLLGLMYIFNLLLNPMQSKSQGLKFNHVRFV